jgi:putative ABC transport system substrate-binding protein
VPEVRRWLERQGAFAHHPALDASWREAADFVDRVLRGTRVGSLPIRTVSEREFVVNLGSLDRVGVTPGADVGLRATRVVR